MPRIAMLPPRRCSQIRLPVLPSIAWMMPPVLFRKIVPLCASGDGWLRAAFVHRPDPRQLQVLRVVARDLRQRAEVRRVVIAPQHEPVARRRILQHLVGDGREVLDFAGDGHTRRAAAPPRHVPPARPAPPGHPPVRRAPAPCRPPPPAACQPVPAGACRLRHGPVAVHRQHLVARRASIRLQDVGDDVEIDLFAELTWHDRAASTSVIVVMRSRVERVLQPPKNSGPASARHAAKVRRRGSRRSSGRTRLVPRWPAPP